MKRDYAFPAVFSPPPAPWPQTGGGPLAVAVPTVDAALSADAAASLASLRRRAPGIPRFLIVPEGWAPQWDCADFTVLTVPAAAMSSIAAYNRMMLTPWFYRLFAGYEALLIFQTDCLLLRDDLPAWASRGYSYVGAPWFANKRGLRLKAVGNGGLSLRRPADALATLLSDRFSPWPRFAQQIRHFSSIKHLNLLRRCLRAAECDRAENDPAGPRPADDEWKGDEPAGSRFARRFIRPEDEFWSFYAPFFHPGYRLPTPAEALDFAFEPRPADCLRLNAGRLPLGCHAWAKIDREFWSAQLARLDS